MKVLSPHNTLGIFLSANVVSWLLLLVINLISYFALSQKTVFSIDLHLKGLLLNFFFVLVFFYFSVRVEKLKEVDFISMLTSIFITGLISNTASLVLQFVSTTLAVPPQTPQTIYWLNVIYHTNIALVTIFLTQTFFYWKRLILHQKSARLLRLWTLFEYLLLISLVFNFFEFGLDDQIFIFTMLILLLLGLVLSGNLKWVAYLNAKEKWQGILLLIFIAGFNFYFFRTILSHAATPILTTDLTHSIYILVMGAFVMFYTIFSILVIIFNLPTTAVFESKMEEILSFQRLAKSLQSGGQVAEVCEALIDTAVMSIEADAAWLDYYDLDETTQHTIYRFIESDEVYKIRLAMHKIRLRNILDQTFQRPSENIQIKIQEAVAKMGYETMQIVPLAGHETALGRLVLLKKMKDGLDDEKRELINTFVLQASISIENFRLLARTIEAARYKEEIKIAQTIQKSLLPVSLDVNEHIDMRAFSQSAYEVGGDYYDVFRIDAHRFILIVGDVSGKGTSAAFNMAQMKGIFHGLVQLDYDATTFLQRANQALAFCFDKSSFITATVVYVDTEKKELQISRAGHCPTLYYNAEERAMQYIQGKGLGLGILRHDDYTKHIENRIIHYNKGDVLALFTDGVIEAQNERREEYGYERLQQLIEQNLHKPLVLIIEEMMHDLQRFCQHTSLSDDHTVVLLKLKN
ncbi:MAG TPA: serine/threonine protein phosphatase [Microscillaceae bacterium]|jgi:serine phosphatase RsbU (regulator of sigma subunit)|nr:serine/threonine protein phosphatase [Microscillaceae bacterium]